MGGLGGEGGGTATLYFIFLYNMYKSTHLAIQEARTGLNSKVLKWRYAESMV